MVCFLMKYTEHTLTSTIVLKLGNSIIAVYTIANRFQRLQLI